MRRGFCVVIAVLFVTVGCGTSQKGATPPPPLATSATAVPTAPATPVASPTPFISTADEAGAFAFTREYFRVLNDAVKSGNVQALQPLRSETCSCKKMEEEIARVYLNGGRVEGAQLAVTDLILGESGPAFTKVTAVFTTSSGQTVDRTNKRTRVASVAGNQYVTLIRINDHWVIDDIKTQVRK